MDKPGPKPAEMLFPGRVTQVNDPHYFWMQIGTADRLACFLKIQRDMQTFCENQWVSVIDTESIIASQLVLVDTGQLDTRYRRAQVTRVISDTADVFFIDYGNTELVTLNSICVEFPPIVRSVPPMAVRCCMAGIKPIAKSWTSRGVKTFTRLTVGYTLQTLVIYADPGYLLVSLYGREGSNPRSIAHQLLDEDVALPIENNEVPEYVSEIPAFMALLQPPSVDPDFGANDERHAEEVTRLDVREPPSSPTKSSDKYIPPGRKQSGSSPGSATRNGPVHDFFPFENVSTYPPTPSDSPTKASSVGKGNSPGSSEGSYFSRSPGRGDTFHPGCDRSDQFYSSSPEKNQNGYRRDYNTNCHDRSPLRASQATESPRNSSNFETAGQSGSSYTNSRNSEFGNGVRGYNSAQTNSPVVNRLQNGSVQTFVPPFFQPKQPFTDVTQMNFSKSPSQPSLTPPSAYEHHTSVESHNFNRALTPPGYYESHRTSNSDFKQGHKFEDTYSNTHDQHYNGDYNNSSAGNVTNSYGKTYPGSYVSSYTSRNDYRESDRDRFKENTEFVKTKTSPSYAEEKTKSNPVRLQMPNTSYPPPNTFYPPPNTSYPPPNVSYPSPNTSKPPSNTYPPPMSTPSKSPGSYYTNKPSPISPESPAIANFDVNDIEHTMHVSSQGLHQKSHQQKLMALQEEADDIAKESQEQMELVKMSRYGRSDSENLTEDFRDTSAPDVFDKIAEEIRDASFNENMQFYEDMKKSPVKRRLSSETHSRTSEKDRPVKLEEMPQSYLVDIDFSVAVKEALDSSKTDGMDNTRALLEAIVESLKAARVEKQLYDVIALLLSTAIHEYNLYHLVVMDTICKLNGEFDIKDTLTKALKRQQELYVRVPAPKNETHLEFSRVMGHVYNTSLDWRDSNSSIQDSVLNTVEKWIVFNNKGTQIGQTDKENMFLDCFASFWEVSSDQLRKHNDTFCTRLQEEVKKKLLNDNVTRSIKERLLSILLEMFSFVESKPSTDMFTQTPRRTMIPSSCQVKPSCSDKGTMTEDEDHILHDLLFSPENRIRSTVENATPEVSLRPAKPWGQECHSTPTEEQRAYDGDKQCFDESLGVTSMSVYSENSYQETSFSVYETPNESLADSNRSFTIADNNGSKNVADNNKSQTIADNSRSQTVADNSRSQTVAANNRSQNAGDRNRSQAVSANNSTLDCPETKSENQFKSGKEKQSSGAVKSEKQTTDHKLQNIGKSKSWASVASSDNVRQTEVKEASAKASIVDWFEYNPEPEPVVMEAVINKKDTSKKSSKSKGNKSVMSLNQIAKEFGSQFEVKQESVKVKHEPGKLKAKGSDAKDTERRQHHESVAEKLAKNTELERKSEKEQSESKSEKEHSESKSSKWAPVKQDIGMQMEHLNCENNNENIDWWGDSDRSKTIHYVTGEDKEVILPPEEKIKAHDEFGFESDFSDDDQEWETHSDSQSDSDYRAREMHIASQKPRFYDTDFPPSDLAESVKPPAEYGASSEVVKKDFSKEYEQEFPDTDLASFIDPPQPKVQETGTRWVPGIRRCTLCGDRDHTTNDCPESASKLFL